MRKLLQRVALGLAIIMALTLSTGATTVPSSGDHISTDNRGLSLGLTESGLESARNVYYYDPTLSSMLNVPESSPIPVYPGTDIPLWTDISNGYTIDGFGNIHPVRNAENADLLKYFPGYELLKLAQAQSTPLSFSDNFAADLNRQWNAEHPEANTFSSGEPDTPPNLPAPPSIYSVKIDSIIPLNTLTFGQRVYIRDDATYFESADGFGSGHSGTANNIYTEVAYLGGFARVDPETHRLTDYVCYARDNMPVGEPAPDFFFDSTLGETMVFLYTDGFTTGEIGWTPVTNLHDPIPVLDDTAKDSKDPFDDKIAEKPGLKDPDPISTSDPLITTTGSGISDEGSIGERNPSLSSVISEQTTPEKVTEAIQDASQGSEKIALILDASGSVDDYSAAIAAYAEQLENVNTVIIFGNVAKIIQPDGYAAARNSVGSKTDIFGAMNLLPDEAFDTVILVTDTDNSYNTDDFTFFGLFTIIEGRPLNSRNNIGSVVILNPANLTHHDTIHEIEKKWEVTPVIRHLNMDGTTTD